MGNLNSKGPKPYPLPQPGTGQVLYDPRYGFYQTGRKGSRKGKERAEYGYPAYPPTLPYGMPQQMVMPQNGMMGYQPYAYQPQQYYAQPANGLLFQPQPQQQPQMMQAQAIIQPMPAPAPVAAQAPAVQPTAPFARGSATPFPRQAAVSEADYSAQAQNPLPAAPTPAPQAQYAGMAGMPTPLPPPQAGVYGPPGPRPLTPLRNPLPPPPRDLYEMEPYRALTQDLGNLWAYPWRSDGGYASDESHEHHRRAHSDGGHGLFGSWGRSRSRREKKEGKRSGGGLFRSLSTAVPETISRGARIRPEIPRSLLGMLGGPSLRAGQGPPAEAPTTAGQMLSPVPQPTPVVPAGTPLLNANGEALSPMTLFRSPGAPLTPLPIAFSSQDAPEYAGFLLTSPHRVHHRERGQLWPTAYHLLEAMRFMRDNPAEENSDLQILQERVRLCKTIDEVQQFVTGGMTWCRPDWDEVVIGKADEILYAKFSQHEELRNLLLSTGDRELVYTDFQDAFWSAAPGRVNELGQALMRLRDRFQQEARAE